MSAPYSFPAKLAARDFSNAKDQIASGTFDATGAHAAPAVVADELPAFVKARMEPASLGIADKYRTKIMGVDYSSVAAELLILLAASRKAGNYEDLFFDLNLGVATAYTVSRDASVDYRSIGPASIYRGFEILGRKRPEDPKAAAASGWIQGSDMNATAVRLVGHLIVECAPSGGFLSKIKASKGTPFTPVVGGKELEGLMRDANAQLTDADKTAKDAFAREFAKTLRVLDHVWGKAGASTAAAEAAAKSIAGALL